MESKTLRVSKTLKKSSAKMFSDLKVGDTVKFSVDLKRAGSVDLKRAGIGRGTYATYIKAEHLESGNTNHSSFNQMSSIISRFEFEEVLV